MILRQIFQMLEAFSDAKKFKTLFVSLLLISGAYLFFVLWEKIEESFEKNKSFNRPNFTNVNLKKFFLMTQQNTNPSNLLLTWQDKTENFGRTTNQDLPLKIILYWNGWDSYMGDQPLIDGMCPVTTCIFTQDRKLFNQSQVVLFFVDKTSPQYLPSYRRSSQRFVFVASKPHVKIVDYSFLMNDSNSRFNFYNWTMTYRQDSDIILRDYSGSIVPIFDKKSRKKKNKIAKSIPFTWSIRPSYKIQNIKKKGFKTKMIAWFSSNCVTAVKREEYIRQLSQYIQVDIYGMCGNLSCGINCNEMLRIDYKFYLAFEDVWCSDYLTEEFYRSLEYNTVPVVLGGADYDFFGPPHSFINVLDFPSVKVLAEYLLLLNKTEELYVKYFDWHNNYKLTVPSLEGWCDLCKMAHDSSLPYKTYTDVKKWWVDEEKCVSNLTKNLKNEMSTNIP